MNEEGGIAPELLWRVGEALWGVQWMSRLATEFDIAPRKVRRWAGGNGRMPDALRPQLVELMRQHGDELAGLVGELEKPCAPPATG
jgi:hypothetical protein